MCNKLQLTRSRQSLGCWAVELAHATRAWRPGGRRGGGARRDSSNDDKESSVWDWDNLLTWLGQSLGCWAVELAHTTGAWRPGGRGEGGARKDRSNDNNESSVWDWEDLLTWPRQSLGCWAVELAHTTGAWRPGGRRGGGARSDSSNATQNLVYGTEIIYSHG